MGRAAFFPIIVCVLICVLLVALPHILFSALVWDKEDLFVRLMAAVFIGLLLAPEVDDGAFLHPVLFQSIAGFIAGGLVGYAIVSSIFGIAVGACAGLFIGFTARYWIKHLSLP